MQFLSLKLAALSLLAASSAAKTIRIDVGSGGKRFSPDSVTAERGDIVEYYFSGSKHSVVASDFDKACSPVSAGGFYSGTVQAKGDEPSVFRVNVTTTDPIFFYCSVGKHCKDGMVGAINPSGDKSLDKFRSNAKGAGGSSSPPSVFGGQLVKPSEGSAPKPVGAAGSTRASFILLGGVAAGAAALLS
ncbi:hypothetical protein HIM_04874 [Hirsutella minnesotensis 3608]|uniref:Phytocyanin domain-containing protein n=1 Tax=Hirsutella minnesotensis 3608 TaxID=1043627 RepID=A0A0F8A0Y9_9HYPO|nr:hypothetical protein HIM_04874 [Hirsutella minnesotensis 3608]